jgi:pyruvate,water dikinase
MGGKARQLMMLQQMGFPVPPFFVLHPGETFVAEMADVEGLYAVRSSADVEDGNTHSFAGQFETVLGVKHNELNDAIEHVRNSAESERMLTYLKQFGITQKPSVSVIVQKMVMSDASGVAFGLDPVTGNQAVNVVSAVFGLGEGLVSGTIDADTWRVESGKIQFKAGNKQTLLKYNSTTATVESAPVPPEQQTLPSLTEHQVMQICQVLETLHNRLGAPQDVEFAFQNDVLYLLQTRPVTTFQGEYMIWDNSNIVESYPGITTPLTYSFIKKMYESVYRQFVHLLGVSKPVVQKNSEVFANTLGLVRGRVYYNLLSWYKMLAMVPGYSLNAGYMETMMGAKERFHLSQKFTMSRGKARFRIFLMVLNMIRLELALPFARRRFVKHLNRIIEDYKNIDYSALSTQEIAYHYRVFEQTLLKKWKAPLTNDFFAMIWFGVLQKQTAKLQIKHNPNLHNDLLCGSSDIISTEPIRLSLKLSTQIAAHNDSRSLFLENNAAEIWQKLQQEPGYKALYKAIRHYLNKFGERCIGELKLESESYSAHPEKYIELLQQYVRQGITDSLLNGTAEEKIRTSAEADVKAALKGKPLKRILFYRILKNARAHVSARENLRYERTRGFGMVRTMFNAMGDKLHQMNLLETPRDVFYLELEELMNLALNTHPQNANELKEQIAIRRAEFSQFIQQEPPSERFFTYGYDFSDRFIYSREKELPLEGGLCGTGCCPGIVEGTVRVVLDPTEVPGLNGDILVTRSTDPGWVTLFPTVSAIIVEKGSLLSHSAIVSREMGIPCIVSVTGLLKTLHTGDRIRMNGSTGEIEILETTM